MTNRIICFLFGVALTYCAIAGGSVLAIAAAPEWIAHPPSIVAALSTVLLTVVVGVFGVVTFCVGFQDLINEKRFDDVDGVTFSAFIAMCAGFLFGVAAQPIGAGATGHWLTPWDILLVLGCLPLVIAGKDIIEDLRR